MRDAVIIGGGLSGLAAAWALQQAGIRYTLIEVKRRLGGSIATQHTAGFLMDSGPMICAIADLDAFTVYLAGLGLQGAFEVLPRDEDIAGTRIIFHRGSGALVDALAARITAPRLMRMAVSTLGFMDAAGYRLFSICMENGMLLDADALIIAAPARHAERMLHTLVPEISFTLLDYRYDPIARVSLGYSAPDLPRMPAPIPQDYPVTTLYHTTHPQRVPPGGMVLQAGVRFDPEKGLSADVVGELAALMGWPLNPAADHIAIWPESDPIMWVDDEHSTTMRRIARMLPDGVALAGSDYIATGAAPCLDERIAQGQAAAQRIIDWLARDKR